MQKQLWVVITRNNWQMFEAWQDGLTGKAAWQQAWRPECDPWELQDERKEQTVLWPLHALTANASTCALAQMCTHTLNE